MYQVEEKESYGNLVSVRNMVCENKIRCFYVKVKKNIEDEALVVFFQKYLDRLEISKQKVTPFSIVIDLSKLKDGVSLNSIQMWLDLFKHKVFKSATFTSFIIKNVVIRNMVSMTISLMKPKGEVYVVDDFDELSSKSELP